MKQQRNRRECDTWEQNHAQALSPAEILERKIAKERGTSPADVLNRKMKKSNRRRDLKKLVIDLLFTVFAVYILFGVVFGISIIQGDSMEPNLRSGDVACYIRLGSRYKKGDIVIMHTETVDEYVKRVIAVAGDEVTIDDADGEVLVNGQALKEPHIYSETYTREKGILFPLTVPSGKVFVLGDNREISKDSREFGVVSSREIAGKVFFTFRTGKDI